jgi:hypothetical protein
MSGTTAVVDRPLLLPFCGGLPEAVVGSIQPVL